MTPRRHDVRTACWLLAFLGVLTHFIALAYPRVPFVWLETATSADSVFLLMREQLVAGA